jgi:putative transposase
VRAGLVAAAQDWHWGSSWQRSHEAEVGPERPALSQAPVPLPRNWTSWVNAAQTGAEEAAIRRCTQRGQPLGSPAWAATVVQSFGLQSTQRREGRPRRNRHGNQPSLFAENCS